MNRIFHQIDVFGAVPDLSSAYHVLVKLNRSWFYDSHGCAGEISTVGICIYRVGVP